MARTRPADGGCGCCGGDGTSSITRGGGDDDGDDDGDDQGFQKSGKTGVGLRSAKVGENGQG